MKILIIGRDVFDNNKSVDFSKFNSVGEVSFSNVKSKSQLIDIVGDYEAVLVVDKTKFDKDVFDSAKKLKYLAIFATGFNNFDIVEAEKHGVTVCNVPSYSTKSVAQLAITFILTLASSFNKYVESVDRGGWIESKTFSYFPYTFNEVSGKTLGILGYGAIGQEVAKMALGMGMKVIAHNRSPKDDKNVTFVDREQLFKESDFLSLNCPLTDSTRGLVNAKTIELMKPTAYIINTARGEIIDEKALADALKSHRIAGVALDTLCSEPMSSSCPLLNAPNCIITPHIGWTSDEALERLVNIVYQNLVCFIEGKPQNVVKP